MAVTAERVAVSDTATPLNTAGTSGQQITIQTEADVDLGDSGVTFGSGLRVVEVDGPVVVQLDAGDVLYAVADATATVQVLRT